MRIREHHCISPQDPIGSGGRYDGFDDGLQNAYFPNVTLDQTLVRPFVTTPGAHRPDPS